VGSIHQRLSGSALHAGQVHAQAHSDAIATGEGAEVHLGVHGHVLWNGDFLHAAHCLERADEAGRVARRKQLLGVGGTAGASQLLGGSQFDVQQAVVADGAAVATAGRSGHGGVKHFVERDGHGVVAFMKRPSGVLGLGEERGESIQANSTAASPTTPPHGTARLGDRGPLGLDAGARASGIPSTILALTSGGGRRTLRPGARTEAQMSPVLGAAAGAVPCPVRA